VGSYTAALAGAFILELRHIDRIAVRVFLCIVIKAHAYELCRLAQVVGHRLLHIAVRLAVKYLQERIRLVLFVMAHGEIPVGSIGAYRVAVLIEHIDRFDIVRVTEFLKSCRLRDRFQHIAFIVPDKLLIAVVIIIIVIELAFRVKHRRIFLDKEGYQSCLGEEPIVVIILNDTAVRDAFLVSS